MELFGEKLRSAREARNYTIEQVSRDTRISSKYLHALEEEEFTAFPGETYLIGFLKSYTEFLGLDSDKYISLYKNYKMQEQEIPITELLDTKKKGTPLVRALIPIGGIVLIAAIVVLLLLTVIPAVQNGENNDRVTHEENLKTLKETYDFREEVITRWFKPGDVIKFSIGGIDYRIDVGISGESAVLVTGSATKTIGLARDTYFDFNSDGKADLRVMYNDLRKDDNLTQMNFGLYKITVSTPIYSTEESSDTAPVAEAETATPEPGKTQADVTIRVKEDTRTVILQADKAEPFTINITFTGYCLLRYYTDGKTREEQFFTNKQILNLDVRNNVKLWISNANKANARISGKEIVMGRAGQVVTKLIRWVKDSATGKYQLEIVSVY